MEPLSKNKVKLIRSLRLKKNRISEGLFVVEGDKMVREIIDSHPDLVEFICTTQDERLYVHSFHTDVRTMKEITTLTNPPSLLAVIKKVNLPQSDKGIILALDGIQDPGNLGTIIRTADWFGIKQIICSKETVDCYNPKVVQSTMGSIFRLRIDYLDLNEYMTNCDLPVYGALLDGKNMYEKTFEKNALLLIGNEGNGISGDLLPRITYPILIPQHGEAESLNASIATAIILAEFKR